MTSIKHVTVVQEDVDEYHPYTSEYISTDSKVAFGAAMEVLFAHVADVFTIIIDVIAEKYKLDTHEVMTTIISHPKYSNISKHPVINSLTYFTQDDVRRVNSKLEPVTLDTNTTNESEKTIKKRTVTIRRKK